MNLSSLKKYGFRNSSARCGFQLLSFSNPESIGDGPAAEAVTAETAETLPDLQNQHFDLDIMELVTQTFTNG